MNKVRSTYKRLDYNNGDFLAHYQWKVMQDSVMFVWGLFRDDEDGLLLDDIKIKLLTLQPMLFLKLARQLIK